MSGRDLRSFLTQHRSGTFYVPKGNEGVAGLTKKCLAGGPNWLRGGLGKVDYGQLLSKARWHKESATYQLAKVQQLSHQGQESKETALLRLHREVWLQEWHQLAKKRNVVEKDLERWKADVLQEGGEGRVTHSQCVEEVVTFAGKLGEERQAFERDALHPVQRIIEKLKRGVETQESEEVLGEVCVVRRKLGRVWCALEEECVLLQSDLVAAMSMLGQEGEGGDTWEEGGREEVDRSYDEQDVGSGLVEGEWQGARGGAVRLPTPLLSCANHELRESLAHEFYVLDSHYQDVLKKLQDKHREALSHPCGGWSEDDAMRFKFVFDQYPGVSLERHGQSRRGLCLDRLAREFPQHSRQQLVEHERWLCSHEAYHKQQHAVLRDWSTRRAGLVVRVQAAVAEYEHWCASRRAGQRARDQQALLCLRLHAKVHEWCEEKRHQASLEAEQAAILCAEQEAWHKEEGRRRCGREERRRRRLLSYHRRRAEQEEMERGAEEQLRLEAAALNKKRALDGHVRVSYRKQLHSDKLTQHKLLQAHKEKEQRWRERRLDLLRGQVAVEVNSDPERLLQHTHATQARLVTSDPPHCPFFPIHGYTANQVTSDPRLRLEAALREAGLLNNEYARHMLSRAQPPSNYRPDQHSVLFTD